MAVHLAAVVTTLVAVSGIRPGLAFHTSPLGTRKTSTTRGSTGFDPRNPVGFTFIAGGPISGRGDISVSAVPPELQHLSELDLDSLQVAANQLSDLFHSSSTLLADAAAATADAATDAAVKNDSGWWQNYLGLFKSLLLKVHSTIDPVLRDAGWDQTWGPSIFLFTAGVRSCLLPFSIQQAKGTERMKALTPYQNEIKERFKDNENLRNRALAKLFEDSDTNPLSGCLLSLAQFPILIGLYRSITLLAREGNLQEPFLWIPSLSGPVTAPKYRGMEWLTEGWVNDGSFPPTPSLGWETTLAFMVMPVLLVLGQKLTMDTLTPAQDTSSMSDEEKEQMEKTQGVLKFLPLMIGYFSLQVPAGLTIYWFTSNLFSLCSSLAVKAYYAANPPEIELPDYWDNLENVDEMSPEEKREAAAAGLVTGPSFDDMLDEARFHYLVERPALREDSAAWARVGDTSSPQVPTEMASWVAAAGAGGVHTSAAAPVPTPPPSEEEKVLELDAEVEVEV